MFVDKAYVDKTREQYALVINGLRTPQGIPCYGVVDSDKIMSEPNQQ